MVSEGWASLVEVQTSLSIVDVLRANWALDELAAARAKDTPKAPATKSR